MPYRGSRVERETAREYSRNYYHNVTKHNPLEVLKRKERNNTNHYKRSYGLTIEQADEMKKDGCNICGVKFGVTLCIDHDHDTKRIRGVLCHTCNLAVGYYEKLADKIKVYLEKE